MLCLVSGLGCCAVVLAWISATSSNQMTARNTSVSKFIDAQGTSLDLGVSSEMDNQVTALRVGGGNTEIDHQAAQMTTGTGNETDAQVAAMTGPESSGVQVTTVAADDSTEIETCESKCGEPAYPDLQNFNGQDLLEPGKMLEQLREHRQVWVDSQLKKDYGEEHATNLFFPIDQNGTRVSVGYKKIFKDPNLLPPKAPDKPQGLGWERMVRKYQMKILQLQLGIIEERLNAKNMCLKDCGDASSGEHRSLRRKEWHLSSGRGRAADGLYAKFTWVIAGHR